jgi:diguanylate cyclase (GGDEF)-like protein
MFSKPAYIAAIGLAGVLGSILGLRALQQAAVESKDLYRIDMAGSQIESDLEYQTQESRRAFLYALALSDPNDQLPYIDTAREASRHVGQLVQKLRQLQTPEIHVVLDGFDKSWLSYEKTRDEIVALVLEGAVQEAIQVDAQRGIPAFHSALQNLHWLKSTQALDAKAGSERVDRTLKLCAVGLAAFILSTVSIIALLGKLFRDRRRVVVNLNLSNESLGLARNMEQWRASVLEMVSTHATLSQTLNAIAEIAQRSDPNAGSAIWVVSEETLRLQVASNLPEGLTESLVFHSLTDKNTVDEGATEFCVAARNSCSQFSMAYVEPRALRDAEGRLIGMLVLAARHVRNEGLLETLAGEMTHLTSIAIENTLLHERLAFQAQHDPLTGLPNRLLFQDRLQQATRLASRHNNQVAVIWIDLDKFKQINDTLGHRIGDELLCEVAIRLKNCLRESDSVARVGGDEFTALAQDIITPEDAETVALKIVAAIARPIQLAGHEITIAASVGVSLFPQHGIDPGILMRHADLAMYGAKKTGGNTHCQFQVELEAISNRRVQVEQALATAIANNEFSLHYQPLVRREGGLESMEALIRWDSATLGKVSPMDFIPIAEETGLIVGIGEWVLRTACRDATRWLQMDYVVPRISVNVSPVQFARKEFGDTVRKVLKESPLAAHKLELEVTETALINNLDRALEHILALRSLGVHFAIDDFGTGYSSLSQLRAIPVDSVKIDRSFIKDMTAADVGGIALVRGIIGLAHSLDLQVVAEGVETAEQLDLLGSMGCDVNQGYFLHRPMPAEAMELLLRQIRTEADLHESEPASALV